MIRKMLLSLAIALSVVASLSALASSARGQQPRRFTADTGIIIPGPHQKVRITVVGTGTTALTVRFRQMEYAQEGCSVDGVCKFSASSQTTSPPISLLPGKAASLELVASTYGRGIVLSNSQDARVTVQLIDTATGEINSVLIALLLP